MQENIQDSLLPAARQGEEGHETAAKSRDLVHIRRVFNAADIHFSDAKVAV